MTFGRSKSPIQLTGTSVAVTGAAGGIGKAIATAFAAQGARVTLGDLDGDKAAAAAADIGHGAVGVALDVSDTDSFTSFLDHAEQTHGPLGVLVNNAGVDWMGVFHDGDDAISRRELSVNLMGPVIGSRLALRRMLPRQQGHIVNVASGAGRLPQPGSAVYTATKHGVVGLTECLDLEYRKSGVRFSLLHPGYIDTAMTEGTSRPSPLVPAATPDDCADAVVKAVQHNIFNVWAPGDLGFSIKLSQIVGRRIRDRVLLATRVDKIAEKVEPTARADYYDRAFRTTTRTGAEPATDEPSDEDLSTGPRGRV
ncbi:SDR family NAD(P)-dependent oxidoreductase [Gordonia sp. NPDC003376]